MGERDVAVTEREREREVFEEKETEESHVLLPDYPFSDFTMQIVWDIAVQLRSLSWRILARVASCLSQPAEFLLHQLLVVRPNQDDIRNITQLQTDDKIMDAENEIPYEQEVDFCTMGMFIIGMIMRYCVFCLQLCVLP